MCYWDDGLGSRSPGKNSGRESNFSISVDSDGPFLRDRRQAGLAVPQAIRPDHKAALLPRSFLGAVDVRCALGAKVDGRGRFILLGSLGQLLLPSLE